MNLKRFTASTTREALALVKLEYGDDAVVMSTRPCPEGIEVVAMANESLMQLERLNTTSLPVRSAAAGVGAAPTALTPAAAFNQAAATAETGAKPKANHKRLQRNETPLEPVAAAATSVAEPASRLAKPAAERIVAATRQAATALKEQAVARLARLNARARVEPSLEAAPVPALAWATESHSRFDEPEQGFQPAAARTTMNNAATSVVSSVQRDVQTMEMSTLSFQEYVRQRMLKRREAERAAEASASPAPRTAVVSPIEAARQRLLSSQTPVMFNDERRLPLLQDEVSLSDLMARTDLGTAATAESLEAAAQAVAPATPAGPIATYAAAAADTPAMTSDVLREQAEMMSELRSMRGLIEQRFGALAFMEKLQQQPRQANLAQRLLDAGFSPGLVRRMVDGLPADVDEQSWSATVLERNLLTSEKDLALEEQGGIYALVGTTGVGKTTSTAKLAAAFAARHGANNLGLITLDAYRVGAHEQLRTYGRILGVPVHTAHDRASLEDLLDLLAGKRMVLIDTAGMAQRDSRTRELLDMVSHSSIKRLLVINASSQGETIEDQLAAYAAQSCVGVVLSKLDEAVKLGPALDSMVRHKLKVVAVANGQRVPEDWHRLSANALIQRALRSGASPSWRVSGNEVNLVFANMPVTAPVVPTISAHA